ncbi:hypothetical protein MHYP_G00126870 [Metynnis hypsauchen]
MAALNLPRCSGPRRGQTAARLTGFNTGVRQSGLNNIPPRASHVSGGKACLLVTRQGEVILMWLTGILKEAVRLRRQKREKEDFVHALLQIFSSLDIFLPRPSMVFLSASILSLPLAS